MRIFTNVSIILLLAEMKLNYFVYCLFVEIKFKRQIWQAMTWLVVQKGRKIKVYVDKYRYLYFFIFYFFLIFSEILEFRV